MNKFKKVLILILITLNLHLSASEIHRTDTLEQFNKVTNVELLIKKAISETKRKRDEGVAIQDVETQSIGVQRADTLLLDPLLIKEPEAKALHSDSVTLNIVSTIPASTSGTINTSLDSLYSRKSNGIIQLPEYDYDAVSRSLNYMSFRDTMLYSPLFLPVVFTGRIEVPDSISFYPKDKVDKNKEILIHSNETFKPLLEKRAFINKVRRDYFIEHPTSIKVSASKLDELKQPASDRDISKKFNPLAELLSSQTSYSLEKPNVEGVKINRVYWTKTGEHSLQFSQNYFSPNWHKGGASNLNINNSHILNFNYNKNKIRFNNRIEWRLSVYNAPDDTLHNYRIGDDLIRYYGDFGLDAFLKSWSYSTNLEIKTQLFDSYQSNSDELRSAFLSPMYINAGIGVKYHIDKRSKRVRNRRLRLNVSISPLSVNYRYVGNDKVNRKRYGIPEGKKDLFDKGSAIISNMTYDITKYISWRSRLKYFTNYSKAEAEFENTLTMSLTQLFSTTLILNLRFDDGVPAHEDYRYFQINEIIGFGLNYKW